MTVPAGYCGCLQYRRIRVGEQAGKDLYRLLVSSLGLAWTSDLRPRVRPEF